MTAVAVLIALTAALGVGYLLGHNAGSRPRSWRKRTSRAALVQRAAGLAALVAVYRLRQALRRRGETISLRPGFPSSRRG